MFKAWNEIQRLCCCCSRSLWVIPTQSATYTQCAHWELIRVFYIEYSESATWKAAKHTHSTSKSPLLSLCPCFSLITPSERTRAHPFLPEVSCRVSTGRRVRAASWRTTWPPARRLPRPETGCTRSPESGTALSRFSPAAALSSLWSATLRLDLKHKGNFVKKCFHLLYKYHFS